MGYNLIIHATLYHVNTIYSGLKLIEKQMLALGQETPVITMDLQLYIIAQEVCQRNWNDKAHLVLRLGGFHTCLLYLKILGKRYSECELSEILIEANILGINAAKVVMSDGHYKRCLIAHKLMFEALSRFQMKSFLTWFSANEHRQTRCKRLFKIGNTASHSGTECCFILFK